MLWRKKRSLDDFDAEIQSHLALDADELRSSHRPPPDGEGAARRAFGNITSIKESFYEYGRWRILDQLSRDIRHTLRMFWRRPSFSAAVAITLAVGIGTTLAIASIINAVLLRPLPYKDPARLAMLWSEDSAHGVLEGRVSLLNFADWKSRSHSFEDMTLFIGQTFLLNNNDIPERMRSARVSADFFRLLGVNPALGRVFGANEEERREAVVVISYSLWRRRFGGSMQVIGSDLMMDGRKRRIIGVMPATFQYPFVDTEVWEPMTIHPYWVSRDRENPRTASNWYTLGRLRPGVKWPDAQSEMNRIAHQLAVEHPENRDQPEIRVVPLDVQTSGRLRLPLAVLFCAVLLMLLIACLNAANLLLANGSAREREFSVRRALGGSRLRITVQLLIESLVLSVAGGALGLGLAAVLLKGLVAWGPRDIPRLSEARIDSWAFLFTLGLCLFTGVFFGLGPALSTGVRPASSRIWTTVSMSKLRMFLVIGEFAIALVLLTGAGLMVRSFVALHNVSLGFRPEKLLVMRIDLHVGRTSDQEAAYFRQAIDRLQALPGVRSAAAITGFLRTDPEDSVEIEGRPRQQPGPCDDLVAGPFLQTAGISLRKGRYLNDQDRRGSTPVALINQAMAKTYWPGEDAIGKRFRFPSHGWSPWMTVVGITGDARRHGIEVKPLPQVFRPNAQEPEDMLEVIVRTVGDPEPMAATVRKEIHLMDRTVAKFPVLTVEQEMGEQTEGRRFQTGLLSGFSFIATGLSAIGIYGLMHFFVIQRAHEIGVRMALGARRANILGLVVGQGFMMAATGIGIGIAMAFGFSAFLSKLLFTVAPTDFATFATTAVILLAVALLACWLPARRAAGADPLIALRQD